MVEAALRWSGHSDQQRWNFFRNIRRRCCRLQRCENHDPDKLLRGKACDRRHFPSSKAISSWCTHYQRQLRSCLQQAGGEGKREAQLGRRCGQLVRGSTGRHRGELLGRCGGGQAQRVAEPRHPLPHLRHLQGFLEHLHQSAGQESGKQVSWGEDLRQQLLPRPHSHGLEPKVLRPAHSQGIHLPWHRPRC